MRMMVQKVRVVGLEVMMDVRLGRELWPTVQSAFRLFCQQRTRLSPVEVVGELEVPGRRVNSYFHSVFYPVLFVLMEGDINVQLFREVLSIPRWLPHRLTDIRGHADRDCPRTVIRQGGVW